MVAKSKEVQAPIRTMVRRQFTKRTGELNDRSETTQEELIGITKFVTEPAKVAVENSIQMNLGNYESARVAVTVSVPCYFEEIDAAYQWARNWVGVRLAKEREAVLEAIKKQKEDMFDGP